MLFVFQAAFFDSLTCRSVVALRPVIGSLIAAILLASLAAEHSQAAETVDLSLAPVVGQTHSVKVAVEVKGELKLNPDGKEVRKLPMLVQADLEYVERILEASPDLAKIRSVRHYRVADAKMRINESDMQQSLREDRRCLVSQTRGEESLLFSPVGPVTREELELVDVPGNSALLATILPGKKVKLGDEWKYTDGTIARLLSLEAVSEQDVIGTLTKMEDDVAILALKGKVSGAVGGVATEIDLSAKVNFDPKKRAVTWLALQYTEKRGIGHAQPGYDATIRLRLVVEPTAQPPELSPEALAKLPLEAKGDEALLEFRSPQAGADALLDRRWRVMIDRIDVAILRLIDRGDLIAQCNITRLPSLPKGEHHPLAAFQKDVEKTLGKNFGQIVEAGQATNENGIRVLKVTVSGFSSELPIQWIYYHLSDAAGRRASVVITLEEKLAERFAGIDGQLIANLKLLDLPTDEEKSPTPAEEPKAAAAKSSRKKK